MIITAILILILIFLFLRLLFSAVFRLLFGWTTRIKRQKNQNVAYKKGETTIISHGKDRSEVPKSFDDYTDYEEVRE
jgi:hypothetical protein